ncbi:MAG: glycosyltransferase family 4 protein [Elusimicrobiota bacterium]|jgi:glycosyltransferase involved in cell wall biosynthesis
MRIALAWLDPSDPTDAAVARGHGRALKALGHQPVLVGPRRSGRGEGTVFGLRFVTASSASGVAALQRRFRFDLWHCHVFGRSHAPLTEALRLHRWPSVASLHLVLPDYLAAAGGRPGLGALLRQVRHTTAVSAWSLGEAVRLWPFLKERSSVVACGLAEDWMVPGKVPVGHGARPFIFCAARQAPYKGLDVLLMAFAKLREMRKDLRLVIAGRDQMKGALPAFARRLGLGLSVSFAGELPAGRVRRLMAESLFFVLPSRREPLGLALMEAMALGKACATSRTGGITELAVHGRHALLAPPGDVKALAGAMERLTLEPDLRERLGTAARQRAGLFTWGRAAAAFERIYGCVLR